MPRIDLVKQVEVRRTPRVQQVESIFDVPPAEQAEVRWKADLPLDEQDWSIGMIVGPSGAGKSSVARELFGERLIDGYKWSPGESVVDGFPEGVGIKTITAALSSVGLGSVPSWLKPYQVLSTGEQFRATIARALAEAEDPIVIDEWTSVVDRQVAKVASTAVAKTIRRQKKRLVAVGCHYDVIEWLQPDWVFEPHTSRFEWRCLQRRPEIELDVYRVRRLLWPQFSPYHYMSGSILTAAKCYGGFVGDRCVGFCCHIPFPHPKLKNARALHRIVVLPDWQGLKIGITLANWVGFRIYQDGQRCLVTTAHPAMIRTFNRSPRWSCTRHQGLQAYSRVAGAEGLGRKQLKASRRATSAFEYVPDPGEVASLPSEVRERLDRLPTFKPRG